MLSIGEFSGFTGLSVKALRHYDEKGVLVPAEVDAQTGYRRYGEEQVREGVIIRALRDADVPLPDLVSDGSRALSTLSAQRTAVLEKRKLEDATWSSTPGAPLPEGTVHPAMVALLDELAEHDIDLRRTEIRQYVIGMSEDGCAVEVCVTVS